MNDTARVVRVDPGEAASGRDEPAGIGSPGPPDPNPCRDGDGLSIEKEPDVDMEVASRKIVPKTRHAVDDLTLPQLTNRGVQTA